MLAVLAALGGAPNINNVRNTGSNIDIQSLRGMYVDVKFECYICLTHRHGRRAADGQLRKRAAWWAG